MHSSAFFHGSFNSNDFDKPVPRRLEPKERDLLLERLDQIGWQADLSPRQVTSGALKREADARKDPAFPDQLDEASRLAVRLEKSLPAHAGLALRLRAELTMHLLIPAGQARLEECLRQARHVLGLRAVERDVDRSYQNQRYTKPVPVMYFAANLRYLRKNARLSQTGLADKVFISKNKVCRMEKCLADPSKEILQALATLFAVSEISLHWVDLTPPRTKPTPPRKVRRQQVSEFEMS